MPAWLLRVRGVPGFLRPLRLGRTGRGTLGPVLLVPSRRGAGAAGLSISSLGEPCGGTDFQALLRCHLRFPLLADARGSILRLRELGLRFAHARFFSVGFLHPDRRIRVLDPFCRSLSDGKITPALLIVSTASQHHRLLRTRA